MLFNSIDFVVFLPLVFILYWFVFNKNLKAQNALLVAASYVFYGWWDWRFLSLIVFSTLVDYLVGVQLGKQENQRNRKILLWTSILVNLGFLGFFKYFNFFLDNFIEAFTLMGMPFESRALSIVLPVGISFYTFQTLSYSIDVYRRKLEPTRDFISFAAFVSFFPQLVAGPIERATQLLPQFYKSRTFNRNQAVDGLRQILWGLFKKVVIADNCAEYANLIFNNSADYNGSTLVLGALFFAFQIYGDFSGYSDIAIGTSRLFGFNLMKNFAFPYFSRDIAEFWRRWHISLSTWFRDYLYIPLGGSHGGNWKKIRNTFIIFVVSGFWHGANWTFVAWGALNALYFMPLMLFNQNRKNIEVVAQGKLAASFSDIAKIGLTFGLTLIAWVFFRAEDIGHAFSYLGEIFSFSLFETPPVEILKSSFLSICLITGFVVIEWLGRENEFAIEKMGFNWPQKLRWLFYGTIIFSIGMFMQTEEVPFIYFQF
jgi:D-alanyl-lipoteichoic acid acyltransferase DltB (MBOAT superfamily)